jgi:hypothetical protein
MDHIPQNLQRVSQSKIILYLPSPYNP